MVRRKVLDLSPLKISALYALMGYLWIYGSGRLTRVLTRGGVEGSLVQSLTGTFFVTASALVIYALTSERERQHDRIDEELREALDFLSLLQRLLRHNLRNSLTVILGHAQLLEEEGDERVREHTAAIVRRAEQLTRLSEKTRVSGALLDEAVTRHPVDLSRVVSQCAERAADVHPSARITTDIEEGVVGQTYDRIGLAIEELVENAVEHNPNHRPAVRIAVYAQGDTAVVEVADEGPGIPDIETQALELDREQPLVHSQGVGLWAVKFIAKSSGGRVTFEESDGTVVRVELQRVTTGLSERVDAAVADVSMATDDLLPSD